MRRRRLAAGAHLPSPRECRRPRIAIATNRSPIGIANYTSIRQFDVTAVTDPGTILESTTVVITVPGMPVISTIQVTEPRYGRSEAPGHGGEPHTRVWTVSSSRHSSRHRL